MIYSFLKNNSWFTGDIIIIHSNHLAILSAGSKERLKKLYSNIIFKEVDDSCYNLMIKHFGNRISVTSKVKALKFDVFTITGYEKVIYSDSDMLFTASVKDMLDIKEDVLFTRHGFGGRISETPDHRMKGTMQLSSAMFVLSSEAINKCHKMPLLKYGEKYNLSEYDTQLFEQSVMNKYFKNTICTFLPSKFNMNKKWYSDSKASCPVPDIRCIHYAEEKPWWNNKKVTGYTKVEKLWIDMFKSIPSFEANKETDPKKILKPVSPDVRTRNDKLNEENYHIKYEKLDCKYAFLTNQKGSPVECINAFLAANKWFEGDIVVDGNPDCCKSVKYNNIIYSKNPDMKVYDRFMFIESSMLSKKDLYGLFTQNHGKVSVVSGNNTIRTIGKNDKEVSWFYFTNSESTDKSTVLFPESYFEKCVVKKPESAVKPDTNNNNVLSEFEKEYEEFIAQLKMQLENN